MNYTPRSTNLAPTATMTPMHRVTSGLSTTGRMLRSTRSGGFIFGRIRGTRIQFIIGQTGISFLRDGIGIAASPKTTSISGDSHSNGCSPSQSSIAPGFLVSGSYGSIAIPTASFARRVDDWASGEQLLISLKLCARNLDQTYVPTPTRNLQMLWRRDRLLSTMSIMEHLTSLGILDYPRALHPVGSGCSGIVNMEGGIAELEGHDDGG